MAAEGVGLAELLASKEIVMVCGTGGVGKTTVSAALATMTAVHLGARVLVLTVDPARRLATALGLEGIGQDPVEIPLASVGRRGTSRKGRLFAAMLDTGASWDDLVHRHAPDRATADRLLANPLYRNLTRRFTQSHGYVAMERLHDLHASGAYDVVVVDTPPSRNALDILEAPAQMAELFGGRLLRWITAPSRSRVVSLAARPFYQVADRILGSRFLQDIAEFFGLLQSMEGPLVARATQIEHLMADPRTTFLVVTTLEPAPLAEGRYLIGELQRRELHLGAVVANKVLPASLRQPAAARSARRLRADARDIGADLAPRVDAPAPTVVKVLEQIADRYDDLAIAAAREAERMAELSASAPVMAVIPRRDSGVTDLAGLAEIGRSLWKRP